MMTEYDIIVLGGGPAGMTAGIYAARSRMRVVILERLAPGGQMATTEFIENYPGYTPGINGLEMAQKMEEHARLFGAEIHYAEVYKMRFENNRHVVETSEGDYIGKTVIIATGASPRRMEVPGEAEFIGRGISFCATCDGAFYRDKKVVVVGGGDSAVDEANYLTRFASQVTIIHRREQLRAIKVLQERAYANPKIDFRLGYVVERVEGNNSVESVHIRDVRTGKVSILQTDGIFVYIGLVPNTEFLSDKGNVAVEWGHIITDHDMATSVPGIFAAGDVRSKSLRQVVTAAADGAIAAHSAEKYIEANF